LNNRIITLKNTICFHEQYFIERKENIDTNFKQKKLSKNNYNCKVYRLRKSKKIFEIIKLNIVNNIHFLEKDVKECLFNIEKLKEKHNLLCKNQVECVENLNNIIKKITKIKNKMNEEEKLKLNSQKYLKNNKKQIQKILLKY